MITALSYGRNKIYREEGYNSGSTAVVCFIPAGTHTVYTATLGDSEAAVFRKHDDKLYRIPLSVVRKPNQQKEQKRIEKNGSKVLNGRLEGSLAVSRSIGDLHQKGLVRKAKVSSFSLAEGDKIVIGSDGFWDEYHKKTSKSLECVNKNWDDNQLTNKLSDFAAKAATRWRDDITVGTYQVKKID